MREKIRYVSLWSRLPGHSRAKKALHSKSQPVQSQNHRSCAPIASSSWPTERKLCVCAVYFKAKNCTHSMLNQTYFSMQQRQQTKAISFFIGTFGRTRLFLCDANASWHSFCLRDWGPETRSPADLEQFRPSLASDTSRADKGARARAKQLREIALAGGEFSMPKRRVIGRNWKDCHRCAGGRNRRRRRLRLPPTREAATVSRSENGSLARYSLSKDISLGQRILVD